MIYVYTLVLLIGSMEPTPVLDCGSKHPGCSTKEFVNRTECLMAAVKMAGLPSVAPGSIIPDGSVSYGCTARQERAP
jgi:hypothetical protein